MTYVRTCVRMYIELMIESRNKNVASLIDHFSLFIVMCVSVCVYDPKVKYTFFYDYDVYCVTRVVFDITIHKHKKKLFLLK